MTEPNPLSTTRRTDRPRPHRGTTDTELAIFAAAEQLLANEPLHDLSVAQIIAEAGISRATFYFYFSSKFAVVVGLLAQVMEEIFEVVQPFVDRQDDVEPAAALRESLTAAVALWARHQPGAARDPRALEHDRRSSVNCGSASSSRFTDALGAEIERERKIRPCQPERRQLAPSRRPCCGAPSACLYVAGLGVDPNFSDESAALEPLMAVWTGTLYGTAPTGNASRPKPARKRPQRKR